MDSNETRPVSSGTTTVVTYYKLQVEGPKDQWLESGNFSHRPKEYPDGNKFASVGEAIQAFLAHGSGYLRYRVVKVTQERNVVFVTEEHPVMTVTR
ncbi:MAG TPA: hypothetical protein VIV60_00815 [Polyangiaceae bacterium]